MAQIKRIESLETLGNNFPVERKKGGDMSDVDRVQAHIDWIKSEWQEKRGVRPEILDITALNIDKAVGYPATFSNWQKGFYPDQPGQLVDVAKKQRWNMDGVSKEDVPDFIRSAYCVSAMKIALAREKQNGKKPDPEKVKLILAELKGEIPIETAEPEFTEAPGWDQRIEYKPEFTEVPLETQMEWRNSRQEPSGFTEAPLDFGPEPEDLYHEPPFEQTEFGPVVKEPELQPLPMSQPILVESERTTYGWKEVVSRLGTVLNDGCNSEQSEPVVAAWMVALAKNMNEAETRDLIKKFEEEFPEYAKKGMGAGHFMGDKIREMIGERKVDFMDVEGWQTDEEQDDDKSTIDILRQTVVELKAKMKDEPEPWASLANEAEPQGPKVKCRQPVTAVRADVSWGFYGTVIKENLKLRPDRKKGDSLEIPAKSFVLVVGFDGKNRYFVDPISGTVLESELKLTLSSVTPMATADVG